MDFDEDIYGESVRLSFIKRIRDELKFYSATQLVAQIRQDVRRAESVFHDLGIRANSSSVG